MFSGRIIEFYHFVVLHQDSSRIMRPSKHYFLDVLNFLQYIYSSLMGSFIFFSSKIFLKFFYQGFKFELFLSLYAWNVIVSLITFMRNYLHTTTASM